MFMQLWKVWETMQNTMFLVSTITRLTIILGSIQEHMRIPLHILDAMLQGKQIIGDEVGYWILTYHLEVRWTINAPYDFR